MNIVFVGASRFGLLCLEKLLSLDVCEVAGVVTAPQTFKISYRPEGVTNVLYADFNEYCVAKGIPSTVMTQGMKDTALLTQVRDWQPDILLAVGWYHLLPKQWLALAPAYGLHASLLPDYSGGAPLVWAMINGETRTGITLFQFADGVDNGPIAGQLSTEIKANDTIATLYQRIEQLGIQLLEETLPALAADEQILTQQDESKRRLFPQRSPEDGVINWTQPAHRIHDFIRAQTKPYPGAFSWFRRQKIIIWQSRVEPAGATSLQPGEIELTERCVRVWCGDGRSLQIQRLCADDQDITALDWFLSKQVKSHECFGSS